jgi:molecular chaperone DnaK
VTFDIDANGILNVSAKDKGTGKEQKIKIESSGLSKEEIERMKAEAEANAASDKIEREKIDKLNQADSLVFQTEKQLKEYGDKLSEVNRSAVESALVTLKAAHQAQNTEGIDAAMDGLNKAWEAASSEMYNSASAEGAQAGSDGNAGSSDDATGDGVSDVDYEEVSEDKK